MRLIDADILEYESGTDPTDPYADMSYVRAEHIENAPTVEAELVRHGRWSDKMIAYREKSDFPEHGDFHFGFQCSECKAILNKTRYCGNCGAKMDGGNANGFD